MRIVHWPHDGGSVDHRCSDWLEVRRGRTRFPVRPLASIRFLIGSGTNCHLQLGGGLPMLHCLLTREDDRWTVEAIAPEPLLLVNDLPCRRQSLEIGDSIRIAEFEFVLRCTPGGDPESGRADRWLRSEQSSMAGDESSGLSANELVHRLEQEFDLIESLEHTRFRGTTALLRAVRHRRAA